MCYNSSISFVFGGVGFLTSLYIYLYEVILKKSGIQYILLVYSVMELLQGVQYYVVNQCSNIWNIYLTEFAYLLVILQPFMWNLFYYLNSNNFEKPIFITAIWLSIIWMIVNVLSRILYDKNKNPQTNKDSVFASDKVCTKRKLTHLYWEWTSSNFKDLNANFLTYLMIWFIPGLVSKTFRSSTLILGVSALVACYMSYASGEPFIFTSLWCYISVPIVLIIILNIIMKKIK